MTYCSHSKSNAYYNTNVEDKTVLQLRWDHADLFTYYNMTFLHLQPVLDELFDLDSIVDTESYTKEVVDIDIIDNIYDKVVDALKLSASASVPIQRKNFYKFWWSQELDCLKDRTMESDKLCFLNAGLQENNAGWQ